MVTWTNLQGIHNVNGNQGTYPNNPESFGNGNPAPPGWVFDHTFTIPGTYEYRCDPHVGFGMEGTIIVEAASTPDVVINEIMYNPPEGGTDSLEFFELFNVGPGAANLNGWTVTEGVTLTFGDVSIPEGGYLIVAKNATAFTNTMNYNGEVVQWESGSLSNGGEDIEIRDADNNVVDYVDYDDELPWPLGTDGEGSSLVLCSPDLDNSLSASWQAASTGTGVTVNDAEIKANPGAASGCVEQEPTLFWANSPVFRNENTGTITVEVIAQYFDGVDVNFNVALGGGSTATATTDFTTDPALPNQFTAGPTALDTFTITVNIIDDEDIESDETIELTIEPTNGTVSGDATLTITIMDNDAEVVVTPIGDINGVDADGVAVFVDSVRTVQGVVHCIDFDGNNGYQFFIVEPETGNGIFVFSGSDVDNYVVTAGDEVQITGTLAQFRGLLEIIPTQITTVSSGNDLVTPETVDRLAENVENKYVTMILGANTPTTNFITQAGGGYNVVVVPASTDTTIVRVEFETNIDSAFIAEFFANHASTGISVTGMVSQRDFEAPFDGFYQLYVCNEDDFSFPFAVNEPVWAADVKLYPNPVTNLLTVDLPVLAEQFRLVDGLGRTVQQGTIATEKLQVNMSQLNAGVYYLQLLNGAEVVTRPIVKQ